MSQICSVATCILTVASAIEFKSVPQPPLNFDGLGKVALAGDFDAISIYSFEGQQIGLTRNGSDSVLVQLPNGRFTPLATADANIEAMCTLEMKDGSIAGVVVGGNFTSLGGVEANGVALVSPTNGKVTPMSGLKGKVNALLCDKDTELVYVGGEFTGENSSNALTWSPSSNWANLPFQGFNKPVKAIIKSANGTIIFGGLFDGLGNVTTPTSSYGQTVNLQSATITTEQTSGRDGFNNPKSIICSNGIDGAGTTWLLGDGQVGSWTADFRHYFRPTKLRLRNTHFEGRGTAEFRFTAFPIGGIMNLTFVDPADNTKKHCESRCPLSDDPKVEFQDFEFVNVIGMNNFRIDIPRFYGAGAGLVGIEVFQDDVFTFAVNDFNEPSCATSQSISNSEVKGTWKTTTAFTDSEYLTANIQGDSTDSLSVTFFPNVHESGNYSVLIFTPGCIQDGTCGSRGRVNISGTYTRDQVGPISTELFETNNFDKYDIIYTGPVDGPESGFRPSITLTAASGQSGPITIVAQKVKFDLISNSTLGLNGLYEYVPGSKDTNNFKDSTVIKASQQLKSGAQVWALATQGTILYAAGNFTSKTNTDGYSHIFAIEDNGPISLPNKGLNGAIRTILASGDNRIYVGGDFTNTQEGTVTGINKVAIYDRQSSSWYAMGAGVNGQVKDLVSLKTSVSGENLDVIAVSGSFTEILANDGKSAVTTDGFAVWVPSKNDWLERLDTTASMDGTLSASASAGSDQLFAGAILSNDLLASGAVSVESTKQIALKPLPLKFAKDTTNSTVLTSILASIQKRATPVKKIEGVVTGVFYQEGEKDLTVVGGHFNLEDNVDNLAIIDHKSNDQISGLSGVNNTSTFVALHVHKTILYAGGSISGLVGQVDVSGLVLYDLGNGKMADDQPAGLRGSDPVVYSISTQPNSDRVFVAGFFDSAGSFACPALCVYEVNNRQWSRPEADVSGTIHMIQWINVDELLLAGDMMINNQRTYLAKLDAKNKVFNVVVTGDKTIPGPVTAFALDSDSGNSMFLTGNSTDGKPFLAKWTGSTLLELQGFDSSSNIRGIQVITLNSDHGSNDYLKDDHTLFLTGSIDIPQVGSFSGVLFNGLTWSPFLLTSKADNKQSTLASLFTQRQQTFTKSGGKMRKGFVVLISLAIALGLVFLIVVLGVLASYIHRRQEGYQPAPTMVLEKSASIQDRVPPAFLFGTIGGNGARDPPTV